MMVEVAPPRSVDIDEIHLVDGGIGPNAAAARVLEAQTNFALTGVAAPPPLGKTRKILIPVEQSVRRMCEKYRRDASGDTPAHEDIAKVVYLVSSDAIQVAFQHAPGRITANTRLHHKSSKKYETLSVDPLAPVPRPFDIDNEQRRLLAMERDCHNAARARARSALEILSNRALDEGEVRLNRTLYEISSERARTGAPLEEEQAKGAETDEIDYLLPFLLAARCQDVNNPSEKEARRADKECRAAYKERLLERVAIIQKRLEAENDDLLRRQQAFSRNRDHGEGAEEEFERYCAEATFRIGILEQRLERQEALVTKKYQELEARLLADPRLAILHDPAAAAARAAAAAAAAATAAGDSSTAAAAAPAGPPATADAGKGKK